MERAAWTGAAALAAAAADAAAAWRCGDALDDSARARHALAATDIAAAAAGMGWPASPVADLHIEGLFSCDTDCVSLE